MSYFWYSDFILINFVYILLVFQTDAIVVATLGSTLLCCEHIAHFVILEISLWSFVHSMQLHSIINSSAQYFM